MIYELIMPQEGMAMSDGDILKWYVKVGDTVEEGQPFVEVEAAKASFTINSPYSGKVVEILYEEGDNVAINLPIARIEG